jgi:hypothetical protein
VNAYVEGIEKRWRDVTRKWPEPWYAWGGLLMRGTGKVASPAVGDIAVEYCIVKEPAKEPTGTHSWHGVALATEDRLPFTMEDDEPELVLSDGSRGRIIVTNLSGEKLLFTGTGPYPKRDS